MRLDNGATTCKQRTMCHLWAVFSYNLLISLDESNLAVDEMSHLSVHLIHIINHKIFSGSLHLRIPSYFSLCSGWIYHSLQQCWQLGRSSKRVGEKKNAHETRKTVYFFFYNLHQIMFQSSKIWLLWVSSWPAPPELVHYRPPNQNVPPHQHQFLTSFRQYLKVKWPHIIMYKKWYFNLPSVLHTLHVQVIPKEKMNGSKSDWIMTPTLTKPWPLFVCIHRWARDTKEFRDRALCWFISELFYVI